MPTTNYNPAFARAGFLSEIKYEVPFYNQTVVELDPLSPQIHEFINGLTEFSNHSYVGEQLTTICNDYHKTTTSVWIVLMVNGLLSRTELQPGMILKIPTLENMQYVIRKMQQDKLARTHAFGSTVL